MDEYTTVDGDVLDAICVRHYGRQTGVTEAVLAFNPGLSAYPPELPRGVRITLPRLASSAVLETVRLWD